MIGSPDMNCNLLNQNKLSPLPSESEPQQESEEEELQQVSYFIERIYSQPVVAEYRVKTIPKLVIHSDANKFWHVRRGTGNFNISFSFDGKNMKVVNSLNYCLLQNCHRLRREPSFS